MSVSPEARSPGVAWIALLGAHLAAACTLPSAEARPRDARDAGATAQRRDASAPSPARCDVDVDGLIEASEWSGPGPIAPALAAQLDRDPGFAQAYHGIAHGDSHLRCTFRVRVNGVVYRHAAIVGNTYHEHQTSYCATIQATVANHVRTFTRQCADLHAGDYYGDRLDPLGDAGAPR